MPARQCFRTDGSTSGDRPQSSLKAPVSRRAAGREALRLAQSLKGLLHRQQHRGRQRAERATGRHGDQRARDRGAVRGLGRDIAVMVAEGIPQAEQLAPLASSRGPTVWRRSSGSLISLAHASDVMLNFTRYSGTVTPHRLTHSRATADLGASAAPWQRSLAGRSTGPAIVEVAADSVPAPPGRPRRWCSTLTPLDPREPPCSQIAHRRCAYSWTSPHTYVAGMQVRRTMVDASVRCGTGWPGSNPGILVRSVRSRLARHEGEELGIEG
jgi:hypothetical protein